MTATASVFDAHRDGCDQCRAHPHRALCAQGHQLLQHAVATDVAAAHARLGVDGRLGAVEGDEEHEPGYGHGV